jgi:hypothetical protein
MEKIGGSRTREGSPIRALINRKNVIRSGFFSSGFTERLKS